MDKILGHFRNTDGVRTALDRLTDKLHLRRRDDLDRPNMAEVQQEILWKPDADIPEDNLARRPSIRFQVCDLCRRALTSPEILQPRVYPGLSGYITSRVTLCGGTIQSTQCSFRAMLLHRLSDARNNSDDESNAEWPDYESMGGALIATHERNDVTVLKIYGSMNDGRNHKDRRSLRFHLQAYLDDPASELITSRPFNQDPGSEEALEQMRQWMKECEQSHSHCDSDSTATATLPSRVIDVRSLKLHQSSKGEVGKYAALTYCWGSKTITSVLVGGNLQALQDDIGLESLPQTIKDAIFITQELGLKYIWIDAYCIIQDSVEDKNEELAGMAGIYSQAYVTLSASSATSVYEGFLHRRQPRAQQHAPSWNLMGTDPKPYQYPRLLVPFHLPKREGVTGTAVLQEGYGEHIRVFMDFEEDDNGGRKYKDLREPIMHRAWTFQERLLSRRILIFGTHELSWQCNGAERSCGAFDVKHEYSRPRLECSPIDPSMLYIDQSAGKKWRDLLEEYTGRRLAFEEDRLVALAGVASRFSEVQGGKDVYLAGLWRSSLRASLLWLPSSSRECSRPSAYVAPSWSWASLKTPRGIDSGILFVPREGKIEDKDDEGRAYLEILHCETTPKTKELPYGQVTGGKLRVRGPLRQMLQHQSTLFSDDEPDIRTTASPASTSSSASVQQSEHEMETPNFTGRVDFDVQAEARQPSSLFYLRVTKLEGLVLVQEQPGVFRRVGFWTTLHVLPSKETADKFFPSWTVMDFDII